jgi:hypothetical protein
MLKLTATACIDAPVQAVWAVLSDLDAIHLGPNTRVRDGRQQGLEDKRLARQEARDIVADPEDGSRRQGRR